MTGELERLAGKGDSDAQLELGRRCESEERTALARGWYARAARQGNVAGLRALAINLLIKMPVVERDGVAMIRSAAEKGDAEALYVCAMLAAQDTDLADRWTIALEYLAAAAEKGWQPARTQRAFLGHAFSAADAISMCQPAKVQDSFDSPRIGLIERFASPEICAWLIERARPHVSRAQVYDAATGQIVAGGVVEQTTRVMENLKAVLREAGTDFVHVVKTTVFLKDMNDFAAMNEVYARYMAPEGAVAPARSTVEVARLPKDVLVEVEVIAVTPEA